MTWLATLVVAIIGGLLGVSGAIASQWLTARFAREERSHQERRDAYAALARATWDLNSATLLFLASKREWESPQREAFHRALMDSPRQAVLLELLGSPAAVAAADELKSYAMERLMELATNKESDVRAHAEELGRRLDTLLDVARGDLRPPTRTR